MRPCRCHAWGDKKKISCSPPPPSCTCVVGDSSTTGRELRWWPVWMNARRDAREEICPFLTTQQRAGIDACVPSASGRSEQRGMVVKSYSFCPLQALLGHVGSAQHYCVQRKHAPHVSCHVQRHVFTAGPRLGSWDCD